MIINHQLFRYLPPLEPSSDRTNRVSEQLLIKNVTFGQRIPEVRKHSR